MTTIDIHAHAIVPGALTAMAAAHPDHGPELIEDQDRRYLRYPGRERLGPLPEGIFEPAIRLADMDRQRVDLQVIAIPPPNFHYHVPPEVGTDFARIQNDALIDLSDKQPDRFHVFATLPLQDIPASLVEIERVSAFPRVRGVQIGSNIDGTDVDDPSLEPVWADLERRDFPVWFHSDQRSIAGAGRMSSYYLQNLIGIPLESTIAAAKLIFGGVLDRHPGLRIGFTHGGGFSPYQIGRWEHGWEVRPEPRVNISETGPRQFFGMMYFDSLTHDAPLAGDAGSENGLGSRPPRQRLPVRYGLDGPSGRGRSGRDVRCRPGPGSSIQCRALSAALGGHLMRTAWIGDLEVSVIGLGCNNFGRALDQEQSAAVVNAALDAGINHFDTASNYGEAQSEAFLGAALGGRRDDVVIATKVGVPIPGWEGSGGAAPDYVRKVLDRSLTELGTDHVDIYMVHFPDPKTPIEDTLAVMREMVDEGKVRQIGCSNFDPAQLTEALAVSAEHGWPPFVCDQVQYSMIHREPEASGLGGLCVETGVGLLPYYPLANGLLTGKTRRGGEPQGRLKMDRYQDFLTDENFDLVEGIERFASERGVTMVQVALGWLLAQEAVPAVAPGATSPEQVAANALAAEWSPSTEDLATLRSLYGS